MQYFPSSNLSVLCYPGYDSVITLYYPFSSLLSVNWSLSGKFQTFSAKSDCGPLQELPNIVICLGNFSYFGKLVAEERWLQQEF